MSTYFELLLVAAIVVYIVDLSGFTQTWLGWLSKLLKGPVRQLRPFSCGQCMISIVHIRNKIFYVTSFFERNLIKIFI